MHSSKPPAKNPDIASLLSSHEGCFACGVSSPGGLQVHFKVLENGGTEAVWQPTPRFRSYPDRIHGGVLATLLDSAIVHALFAQGIAAVTADLHIRYLHPANFSHPLQIQGRVDSERSGVYFCSAEASQNMRTIVRASAKFIPTPQLHIPAEPNRTR